MQNNVTTCQNAKCLSHTSIYVQCVYTYKSQSPNSVSPAASYYKTYEGTTPTIYSPGSTPASTTAAWVRLRALRDTGNICHGSPDLGEGSSRAHTYTTCPWNAKRKRQDNGCTCMCGDSRGCPVSSGDKPICTYIYCCTVYIVWDHCMEEV